MSTIRSILVECAEWTEPQTVEGNLFRLNCRMTSSATAEEIAEAWPGRTLPTDLAEFWMTCREADLFADVDYRQWGLSLLSPIASATKSKQEQEQRSAQFSSGDVVLGEFLGDQDLLIVTEDGETLVALPLDDRPDWFRAAPDLSEFLRRYIAARGDKYWERVS